MRWFHENNRNDFQCSIILISRGWVKRRSSKSNSNEQCLLHVKGEKLVHYRFFQLLFYVGLYHQPKRKLQRKRNHRIYLTSIWWTNLFLNSTEVRGIIRNDVEISTFLTFFHFFDDLIHFIFWFQQKSHMKKLIYGFHRRKNLIHVIWGFVKLYQKVRRDLHWKSHAWREHSTNGWG